MSDDTLVLDGKTYHSQDKIAADRLVDRRTVARIRQAGCEWLDWAGKVWLQPTDADRFILASRRRRRNPPRPTRRRRQQVSETSPSA